MKIQPRIWGDELTPEQLAMEARYWQAVDILKAAGFNADYNKVVVSGPKGNPGYITLEPA